MEQENRIAFFSMNNKVDLQWEWNSLIDEAVFGFTFVNCRNNLQLETLHQISLEFT